MPDDTNAVLPLPTFLDEDHDVPERFPRRDKSRDTDRHMPEALTREGKRGEKCSVSSTSASIMHPPRMFNECFPPTSEGGREMRWGFWSVNDRQWIKRVEDNYNCRHCNSSSPTNTLWRIPRIIHHIWLGGELPRSFSRLRTTWQSRHEDWELRLWTDSDVETFGLENREAYNAAGNFGEKSDILRYEILLRQGGLYVDVDFLCLGAFDDLHRRYDFYAGVSNTGTFELNNGLVGCRPGHPIMRTLVTRIRGSCGPRPPAGMGTNCGRGPFPSDLGNSTSCLTTALMDKSMPPTRNEDIENTSSATRASCTTGRGAVDDRAEVEMGTSIGDPLAAVVKAFGDNRGRDNRVTTREDEENDVLRGLLAGLLADEDRECLAQAVKVPPGLAMATIARTGPGAFTLAAMEWMCSVNTAGDAEVIGYDGERCGNDKASTLSADGTDWEEPEPAAVMILPPSYFYPVPNDVEGDLVGDGNEGGVIDRVGRFFSRESLAAHLWAKSWQ